MRNTREILRLKWEKGLAIRQIARSLNIFHSTVKYSAPHCQDRSLRKIS
jgi:DNA-binding NarL/FixJ family response regulator